MNNILVLILFSIISFQAIAEVTVYKNLDEALTYLRPTQYARGAGNVQVMMARFIQEWLIENYGLQENQAIDLTQVMSNLSQGEKSFVDYINKKLSAEKNSLPVWATQNENGQEIGLQTDGHHRTSAFVDEFLSIMKQKSVNTIYESMKNLLAQTGRSIIESGERIDKEKIYAKPINLRISIKNKESESESAKDLKSVLSEMIVAGKILPRPERLAEWASLRKKLIASEKSPSPLSEKDLRELLWGTKGLLPRTFADLEDDPQRSFMGSFMFLSKLDSQNFIDYVEFRKNVSGDLFGNRLRLTCKGMRRKVMSKSGLTDQLIPSEVNAKNWNDEKILLAFQSCLFNDHRGQALLKWLKSEGAREKSAEGLKRTGKMVDLAQLTWLGNEKNLVQGDREAEMCNILKHDQTLFNLSTDELPQLKNKKTCTALIKSIIDAEHNKHLKKANP